MPSEQDAVGRIAKLAADIICGDVTLIDGRDLRKHGRDLDALLARVETLEAAHRTLKLGLVESLGPCAPEHDGTDALDAVRRIVAENAALRERLAASSGWAEDEELAALRADKARLDALRDRIESEGPITLHMGDWPGRRSVGGLAFECECCDRTIREALDVLVDAARGEVGT